MQSGGAQPAPDIGQSQQAATAAPDSNCTQRSFGGGEYWFCDDHRDWQDAQGRCRAVGLDLVRVDTSDENDFVRSHVGSDTWIGGNDRATEGTWVWPIGGDQFWQGDEHGSAVGGLFESWGAGQPNDLGGEDCAQIFPDGNWLDDGCEDREEYVCEQVDDDCPADPTKAEPGQCGCGAPDTDSDGDGFADCQDECPSDPAKLAPGDCGCADSPAPAGTACNDGLCPASAQCDGAGSCGDPQECAPDTGCTLERFHTVPYWFCRDDKTWVDARDKCQAAGMDLVQIESAEENEFIRSKLHEESFIGATDSDVEGEWRWAFSQQEFWEGDEHTGAPVDDAYNNWNHDEPEDLLADERDCGKITQFSGDWRTDRCTTHTEAYVCELVDLCPLNPNKNVPGQCGCAVPDTDVDSNGVADCLQATDDDCDGALDVLEVGAGLDPTDPDDGEADPDGDTVPTGYELLLGSDPNNPDTDGDGVSDETDILTGTDLDGDEVPFEADTCPEIPNPGQEDADGDGRGDVCDEAPTDPDTGHPPAVQQTTTTPLFVLQSPAGSLALASDGFDPARAGGDQKGLLPSGTSFLVFGQAVADSVTVTELFNVATGEHAYATSPADVAARQAEGFEVFGSLGHLTRSPVSFGEPVAVRHFVRSAGGVRQEAVTADGAEAEALMAAGFTELSVLGYGLVDRGRLLVRGTSVVRYRRASDGASLHSVLRNGEQDLSGYDTEGPRFSILSEKNGWTVPVYRLRDGDGREALSADPDELSELSALGYQVEGILGFAFPETPVDTLLPLVPLVRVSSSDGRFEHSVDPAEIEMLEAQEGFTDRVVVARVVAMTRSVLGRDACVGAPTFDERFLNVFSSMDPVKRELGSLYTLAVACTIERALTGQAETPIEQMIADRAATFDPETLAQAVAHVQRFSSMAPSTRTAALGSLAGADPGNCEEPVEPEDLQHVQLLVDPALVSGPVRLRAPQCEGLVDTNLNPGTDPRAITVVESEEVVRGDTPTVTEFSVRPRLYGVLGNNHKTVSAAPGSGLGDYADEDDPNNDDHPNIGFPLIGIPQGPCNTTPGEPQCPAELGQMCVEGQCRAYPMVERDSLPTFTGVSFWDTLTPSIKFISVDPNVAGSEVAVSIARPPIDHEPTPVQLCNPTPLDQTNTITNEEFEACMADPPPGNGLCEPPDIGPDEPFVDRAKVVSPSLGSGELAAKPGFYTVQIVNRNGRYYLPSDTIPVNFDQALDQGRTVHICLPGLCDPAPSSSEAACELGGPGCVTSTGGLWNTFPRSLDECQTLGGCAETPLEFASETEVDGLPLVVRLVDDVDEDLWLNATFHAMRCDDETGWDILGSDEPVLAVSSAVDRPLSGHSEEDIANAGERMGVVHRRINRGHNLFPNKLVSSFRLRSNRAGHVFSVIQLAEDDSPLEILANALGVVALATVEALLPDEVPVFVEAAGPEAAKEVVTEGLSLLWGGDDPDDFIGQIGLSASLEDVTKRGELAHDGRVCLPGTDAVDMGQVQRLPRTDQDKEVSDDEVGQHPGVDLEAYYESEDLVCCEDNAACDGKICVDGACVPENWADPTVPPRELKGFPGHVEHTRFKGSGARYRIYMTYSISNEDPKVPPTPTQP